MKKTILMMAILTGTCSIIKGQTLTVGPKVGVNVTSLSNLDDIKSRAGFTAGGFLVYSFVENFGIGLDAMYSMEGAKYEYSFGSGEDQVRLKNKLDLNYLRFNVPLTYFFRLKPDNFRPKIYAGPSIAFLMSAKSKTEVVSAPGNSGYEVDEKRTVTDNYKGTDFGAVIGTGFNYRLAEATWLNFDVAYHIGATDIPKDSDQDDPIKNRGLSLTAGVGFGF
jgi:outer membrane protein W